MLKFNTLLRIALYYLNKKVCLIKHKREKSRYSHSEYFIGSCVIDY